VKRSSLSGSFLSLFDDLWVHANMSFTAGLSELNLSLAHPKPFFLLI
jgi:hypothetical protein